MHWQGMAGLIHSYACRACLGGWQAHRVVAAVKFAPLRATAHGTGVAPATQPVTE